MNINEWKFDKTQESKEDSFKKLGSIFKQIRKQSGASAPAFVKQYRLDKVGITDDFYNNVERGTAVRRYAATTNSAVTMRRQTLDKIQHMAHTFEDLISPADLDFILNFLDEQHAKLIHTNESITFSKYLLMVAD